MDSCYSAEKEIGKKWEGGGREIQLQKEGAMDWSGVKKQNEKRERREV